MIREMKKYFIIGSTIFALLTLIGAALASHSSEMNYYKYADSLDLAEIIDTSKLTNEELENRNGKLIIERVIGVVDDTTNGSGHVIDNNNFYISYSGVKGIKNGDVICSYFVYNPDTNYMDDILYRFDYVIDSGHSFKANKENLVDIKYIE